MELDGTRRKVLRRSSVTRISTAQWYGMVYISKYTQIYRRTIMIRVGCVSEIQDTDLPLLIAYACYRDLGINTLKAILSFRTSVSVFLSAWHTFSTDMAPQQGLPR
jgi:hypothetical protein